MKLGSRGSNQPLAGSPAGSVAMWQHLTIGVQFFVRRAGIVNVEFDRNVTVVEPVDIYGCAIVDGSSIRPFVEIQEPR